MRKEIEALKNLIAAMDAEEKARHHVESESQRAHREPVRLDERGAAVLSASHSKAIEDWAKAFSDLCAARGVAKYWIEREEREAVQPAPAAKKCFDCDGLPGSCHMNCGPGVPRDDDNGPAARLS